MRAFDGAMDRLDLTIILERVFATSVGRKSVTIVYKSGYCFITECVTSCTTRRTNWDFSLEQKFSHTERLLFLGLVLILADERPVFIESDCVVFSRNLCGDEPWQGGDDMGRCGSYKEWD